MMRSAISVLAAGLCVGCFLLATDGIAKTARATKPTSPSEAPAATTRVLMIGDSLSVGAFGEAVQKHLARKYGPQNVAAYASCGSSPENWLASEPPFITKCGYRESTPDQPPIMRDFVNGQHPRPTLTPKVEALVRRYQPTIVLVQQGTNWMDRSLSADQISSTIGRFIRAARGSSVRQIVWIAPPDSSAFRRTQGRIHTLIKEAGLRDGFEVIDSRKFTHYFPGKTGSDGIHYNSAASLVWASQINGSLDVRLRPRIAAAR
jgi:hypothetical protein